ncbi:hypothetical protein [Tepidibacter hydrothermalis]|uniref:Uncharacterized protein n=1 Tax=Tepidibacter hydrothermalis TaxID=3036126 RepID=A0ABY8EG50_9FIRM|nr:hypothetical protein [Tepidibacter hydrothermalis]WFD11932.1 hypothetical protein P4S50_07610 [Tepidibacter hydrothermalis]
MNLLPLKISSGFAVCYNKFYDVEPIVSKDSKSFIENWSYFTEDILQITKMELKNGHWYIPDENYILIDLGWYPDSSSDGEYVLLLVKVDEEHNWKELKEKRSRDSFEIKETLETWMQQISTKNITY